MYALQGLSISWSSGASLSGFLSRCPDLRVLKIHPLYSKDKADLYENMRIEELVQCLNSEGSLPNLQHLDISLYQVKKEALSKLTKSMRCLRSFQFRDRKSLSGSLSLQDFRPHFSTLTVINVISSPEFWREVFSSCPALVKAQEVYLYEEDIVGGRNWPSTALTFLHLTVLRPDAGITRADDEISRLKVLENALFRRVATLLKLEHFSIHYTNLSGYWSLGDQSWQVLSKLKTLASLELRYNLLPRIDESLFTRISKLRKLKNFAGSEDYGQHNNQDQMIINKIKDLGVSVGMTYFTECKYFTNSEPWLPL